MLLFFRALSSLTLLFSLSTSVAAPVDVEFSLPTTDHRATIRGVITLPHTHSSKKLVPVIIVNGTAGTRDGGFYAPYNAPSSIRSAYSMLRIVATELAREGFAVIRYDSRGITSQPNCERLRKSRRVSPQQYLGDPRCYDKTAALTITYDSKKEDLASVYAMVQQDQRLDASRILMLPVSEGGVHTARLIAENTIKPFGIVFWSVPVESLQDIMRWQTSGIEYEKILDWIQQQKTVQILPNGYFSQGLSHTLSLWYSAEVVTYHNMNSLDDVRARLDAYYQKQLDIIFSMPANEGAPDCYYAPNPKDSFCTITSSMAAIQGMFSDQKGLIGQLSQYPGRISFLYGKKDQRLSADTQLTLLRPILNTRIRTVAFPDLSHSLTTPDNHFTSSVVRKIVQQVQWVSHK
jgi:dienelactone hydrolase